VNAAKGKYSTSTKENQKEGEYIGRVEGITIDATDPPANAIR
jgi:hypothetical protein